MYASSNCHTRRSRTKNYFGGKTDIIPTTDQSITCTDYDHRQSKSYELLPSAKILENNRIGSILDRPHVSITGIA